MGMRSVRRHLGDKFNEGARLLWVRMTAKRWTQADVIRRIRETTGRNASGPLSRFLYGESLPSLEWAIAIEDAVGIKVRSWTQAPTAPFVPPAVEAESARV